jgi:regulation of enolase protein 1 (concanavalin A-like superfamily)
LSFDFVLTARLAASIAPPSAFKATAVAHNQLNLTWLDTVAGELGFKIERSIDGTNFTEIGTAAAGVTAYSDTTAAGDTQYWYRARSYNAAGDSRSSSVSIVTTPQPPPPPDAVPAPWTNGDVGAVAAAGSATHTGGVFTVNGSGADIAGTLDEFHFVSRAWTGNGTIIARVNSITNTNAGAKAGIMFRESTAANARHVMISITPANTIVILARGASGNTSGPPVVTGITTPIWLKLVRNGDIFSAQYSTDGTTWSAPSSSSPIPMAATILVGMCVTSKNDGVIATGNFDNVSVSNATTLGASQDSAAGTRAAKDKWRKTKPLTEQVGLKDPIDLLA